jgi:hypothetical protein
MATLKHLSNTPPQLRQGRAHIDDPIAHAKATGQHFSDTSKHNEIHETPDSKPSANDLDSARGFAPINPAAKPNTYTAKGGSKRD